MDLYRVKGYHREKIKKYPAFTLTGVTAKEAIRALSPPPPPPVAASILWRVPFQEHFKYRTF